MNKKLYVGGLPYSVTDEQLRELFAAHGTVESATVITDKFTDRSRGFGFVEMSTQEETEKAIAALNGSQMGGRVGDSAPPVAAQHGLLMPMGVAIGHRPQLPRGPIAPLRRCRSRPRGPCHAPRHGQQGGA